MRQSGSGQTGLGGGDPPSQPYAGLASRQYLPNVGGTPARGFLAGGKSPIEATQFQGSGAGTQLIYNVGGTPGRQFQGSDAAGGGSVGAGGGSGGARPARHYEPGSSYYSKTACTEATTMCGRYPYPACNKVITRCGVARPLNP